MGEKYCPLLYHLPKENKPNEFEPRCNLSDNVLSRDCLDTESSDCKILLDFDKEIRGVK